MVEADTEPQDSDEDFDDTDTDGDSQDVPLQKDISQSRVGLKKWILISLLGLILIFMGLGLKFGPKIYNSMEGSQSFIPSINIDDDNLSEEILSPFFIPLETGSSKGAIRIDLSVIWDGLASVRYKKKELRIRSNLYGFIIDLAEETEDLNNRISFLEAEIGRVFRDSLGVRDLAIKIKEIKYL